MCEMARDPRFRSWHKGRLTLTWYRPRGRRVAWYVHRLRSGQALNARLLLGPLEATWLLGTDRRRDSPFA